MRLNEPSAAFKLLGGHIVLHFALFTVFLILEQQTDIVMKFSCGHDHEKDLLKILIISHIVSGALSVLYELSTHMGWYTT
jgi:hypothetical protein